MVFPHFSLIYVVPLALIVFAFVRAMGARKLTEREGRLLKLLSGMMMLELGLLLLLAPERLSQVGVAFALMAVAVGVTWGAATWSRKVAMKLDILLAIPTISDDMLAKRLADCRTLAVDSEKRLRRSQFLPDLQPHNPAMGQKAGEKWTAAVALQPTIPKSGRLLGSLFNRNNDMPG